MSVSQQTATIAASAGSVCFGHFVDGEFITTGSTFAAVNPATGHQFGVICEADGDTVDRAVAAARQALHGPWGTMGVAARLALLRALAARITERFDDFLQAEIRDTGKPASLASHIDIPRGAANFSIFADMMPSALGESLETETPDGDGALNYTIRRPRGVIAVICPWNLPLLLMTWKVAPALAAGNTVVVKPSEETPATALLLAEVMQETGIPDGVYNVVNGKGGGSTGEFLTRHPGVDGITFTGETGTGSAIMRAAAERVRPVSFELGGKNAAIVFADCDFDKAIEGTTRSIFANCGQVCLGTERVYVQRPIFDRFLRALAAQARALKPGAPFAEGTTLGPLISAEHKEKVLSYYALAARQGATVITGGGVPEMPNELADGFWVEPTLWTGLPEDSPVITEEIFGPCAHIAPFDDESEAIALANASEYGLATAIWTENISRAHRVGAAIEVGTAWINCWFLRDLRAPFGGAKRSGIGREGGLHGLEFYTELRNLCVKL